MANSSYLIVPVVLVAATIIAENVLPFLSRYICTSGQDALCNVSTDKDIIGNFIEWFGVPYGLLAALVLVNVWVQNEMAARDFDREADAVQEFHRTLCLLKETFLISSSVKKEEIQNIVRKYARHVRKYYQLEGSKVDGVEKRKFGDRLLMDIQEQVSEIVHSGEDMAIKTELLKQINKIVDIRGDRIANSQQRVPNVLMNLLFLSSLIWVIPFLLLTTNNLALQWVMPISVITVVIWMLLIIRDLDDPFTGSLQISTDSWDDILNDIDKYMSGHYPSNGQYTETVAEIQTILDRIKGRDPMPVTVQKSDPALGTLTGLTRFSEAMDALHQTFIPWIVQHQKEINYLVEQNKLLEIKVKMLDILKTIRDMPLDDGEIRQLERDMKQLTKSSTLSKIVEKYQELRRSQRSLVDNFISEYKHDLSEEERKDYVEEIISVLDIIAPIEMYMPVSL